MDGRLHHRGSAGTNVSAAFSRTATVAVPIQDRRANPMNPRGSSINTPANRHFAGVPEVASACAVLTE
jgi:hypothetical protein